MSNSRHPPASAKDMELFKCISVPRGSHKDLYVLQSLRMVMIHNVFIRGYNSILYYSAHVDPNNIKRVRSFIRYCELVNTILHHHHGIEEGSYFPWLEERLGAGSMSENVGGHHSFEPAFKVFEELVTSIRDKGAPFVPDEFRTIIYAFMAPLVEHLKAEIETLRPEKVKHIPEKDMRKMEADTEKLAKKAGSLMTSLQFVTVNGDFKYGRWFPPVPAPIRWICMNITYPFNSDLWAFGSCTKKRIKPEFAAYEPELEPERA
ncbi:hypothetical protein FRB94_001287 [Tulasnella sp. JGI-2019a]|nr:hypothetical protein FRB93_007823 [Tulasnella sp. JGI-2019a]KAG9013725.1 hypothetical protein FRB94_001287 [Tulasnella sp. JGI-2019a]KAG9037122.1 hypothetical protein FRB95_006676 [Tulasnella sp. JGI-2019a]